ncbi:hypothetical protein M427DRAFT_29046 [Gonapodya prolifera JEL478]|uniref:Uncharacterized protein n=1 Tax=Gonapodya prolifera (strain JEL478) TaxID=1344416 RepID=A0A139ASA0_GONPJ|nr:hypothetical protein M427DRAFT_29046 [Gonapodya prolifera JEL478]|eukprot:KXS19631.1 hypothetical protein M427DRAFT_29046 [Gonapodya prolifera JEL478]
MLPTYLVQRRWHFASLTRNRLVNGATLKNWAPTLAVWGGVLGFAALWLLEPVPTARVDIYQNLPVVGGYWKAKLDQAAQKD